MLKFWTYLIFLFSLIFLFVGIVKCKVQCRKPSQVGGPYSLQFEVTYMCRCTYEAFLKRFRLGKKIHVFFFFFQNSSIVQFYSVVFKFIHFYSILFSVQFSRFRDSSNLRWQVFVAKIQNSLSAHVCFCSPWQRKKSKRKVQCWKDTALMHFCPANVFPLKDHCLTSGTKPAKLNIKWIKMN